MTITGTTRVFMIVGDPVAQVKAPQVYNHLFAQNGIDAVLVPMKVPPAQLAGFVRNAFAAQNVGGMWVTIPHKAAMQGLMDRCDPLAQLAGAVNAVRRGDDGQIEGALFDGIGFVKGLDHFGVPVAGRRVLVLGAGGGGQARGRGTRTTRPGAPGAAQPHCGACGRPGGAPGADLRPGRRHGTEQRPGRLRPDRQLHLARAEGGRCAAGRRRAHRRWRHRGRHHHEAHPAARRLRRRAASPRMPATRCWCSRSPSTCASWAIPTWPRCCKRICPRSATCSCHVEVLPAPQNHRRQTHETPSPWRRRSRRRARRGRRVRCRRDQDRQHRRTLRCRRHLGHQLQERRRACGQGDQCQRWHPRSQDRDEHLRHAEQPRCGQGLAQKAVDDDVFAVFGPVFSGSIMVSMAETRRAEIPNFTGGEAASITKQGNPYIFRTSFTQGHRDAEGGALHRREPEGQDRRAHLREQRLRQGRAASR